MTEKTKKLVLAALMCALTCVATMVIRIPTPTMGYIHPGDALVLLCAFLLGPVPGALAAGICSLDTCPMCRPPLSSRPSPRFWLV